jgi:hypothetical protein
MFLMNKKCLSNLVPRQRQTDASNLFFSAPASLCLKPGSYHYVTQDMPCWHKKLRRCIYVISSLTRH